jgi:exonuclease III
VRFAKSHEAWILALQETHTNSTQDFFEQQVPDWHCLWSHGSSNSRGVGVLFRKDRVSAVSKLHSDQDGRILIVKLVSNLFGTIKVESLCPIGTQVKLYMVPKFILPYS